MCVVSRESRDLLVHVHVHVRIRASALECVALKSITIATTSFKLLILTS